MTRRSNKTETTSQQIRCAVYTRKSTEEGLEQEFNSLDAQREAGEAYVKSQTGEGWVLLPTKYDDGGFTGGNMERPALKQLMADIDAGKVDVVVVYKVDRLSRSLLDFARMMQVFEDRHVSFVSITQQFNSATSMGRLVLNVLLSFAQFEREIISERTRDKIAATRRKGKWTGGHPILGYDVDPVAFKLHINTAEAEQVRAIFDLYLEHKALLPVVEEVARRGWQGKRWQTRKAGERGGKTLDRPAVYRLLTNHAYIGQVRYKDEVHAGEHTAIIASDVFDRVQRLLHRNGQTGGAIVRQRGGALLQGLLRCGPCDSAMSPTFTTRGNTRRYRYYVCCVAQKRGRSTCPSKSIPAGPIEAFVVDRVRCIGRDADVQRQVLAEVRRQDLARIADRVAEEKELVRDLAHCQAEVQRLAGTASGSEAMCRMADLTTRSAQLAERLQAVRCEGRQAGGDPIDLAEATRTLAAFDAVWETLTPRERARIIELLVERVVYDGTASRVDVSFRAMGIKTLIAELHEQREQVA